MASIASPSAWIIRSVGDGSKGECANAWTWIATANPVHVHEMGTPGPRLRFTFSFPSAGRYLAWAQYATGDHIVTAPLTINVTASGASQ